MSNYPIPLRDQSIRSFALGRWFHEQQSEKAVCDLCGYVHRPVQQCPVPPPVACKGQECAIRSTCARHAAHKAAMKDNRQLPTVESGDGWCATFVKETKSNARS